MLSKKQIAYRSSISPDAALRVSIQHHQELSLCTQKEFWDYVEKSELNYANEIIKCGFCGLCQRYATVCHACPILEYETDKRCDAKDSQWYKCVTAILLYLDNTHPQNCRVRQQRFRAWQKEEHKMAVMLKKTLKQWLSERVNGKLPEERYVNPLDLDTFLDDLKTGAFMYPPSWRTKVHSLLGDG